MITSKQEIREALITAYRVSLDYIRLVDFADDYDLTEAQAKVICGIGERYCKKDGYN